MYRYYRPVGKSENGQGKRELTNSWDEKKRNNVKRAPSLSSSATSSMSPSSSSVPSARTSSSSPSISRPTNFIRKKIPDPINVESVDDEPFALSHRQFDVLEAVMNQKSVFFTGAAGTGLSLLVWQISHFHLGKSYILQRLRELGSTLGIAEKIVFTAPTGLAACNIGGVTIHSWAGIGLGTGSTKQLVDQILGRHEVRNRWRNTDILVIDEISMLSAEIFDTLSEIGKRVRNNFSRPFGGIQLVVCGDFFQLPPVQLSQTNRFCFESSAWQTLFPTTNPEGDIENENQLGKVILLDRVYRQKENAFLDILNEIRVGEMSHRTIQFLEEKKNHDRYRAHELEKQQIQLEDPTNEDGLSQQFSLLSDRPTKLFGHNVKVEKCNTDELAKLTSPEMEFKAEDWGVDSSHRNQIKNGSRLPELLKLKVGCEVMLLWNLDCSIGLVNGARGRVIAFEKSRGRSEIFKDLPRVEFRLRVGDNEVSETQIICEQETEIRQGNSLVASRKQLPLMLAYAISIHKAQGMTIPKLEVSFDGVFEYGQAYVALSRATDLEGLFLTNFQARVVKAHKQVKDYYSHFASSTPPPAEEKMSSLKDFCLMYRNAILTLSEVDPSPIKNDGWIVKKGSMPSDDEQKTSPLSNTHSASPALDDLDYEPDPFSAYRYDDFMEHQRFSSGRSASHVKPASADSTNSIKRTNVSVILDEEVDFVPKRPKNENFESDEQLPLKMVDFLPNLNSNSNGMVLRKEWSTSERGNLNSGNEGRRLPLDPPVHSHMRCVDPNKTWNMISRTGPVVASAQPPFNPGQISGPTPIPSQVRYVPQPQAYVSSISENLPSKDPQTEKNNLEISQDLQRKIEANKQKALARLQENRAKRQQETDGILSLLS